jgi:predicted Fe-Mo cluster-binding NifX family protein
MRIAVPAKEKTLESKLDERFARAAYFLVYDTEDESYEFFSPDNSQEHGVGTKIVNELSDQGIDAVISKNLGENALTALKAANIKAYIASDGNVQENIDLLKLEKLQEF